MVKSLRCIPSQAKLDSLGKPCPRKTTKQGVNFIRDKLEYILFGLKSYSHILDHDCCDAAVAAYTALLHHQKKVDALGSNEEGVIVISI